MAKKIARKVSITYQDLAENRDWMRSFSKDIGFTRMQDGEEVGEISPILGLATEYVRANEQAFRDWLAKGKPVNQPVAVKDKVKDKKGG